MEIAVWWNTFHLFVLSNVYQSYRLTWNVWLYSVIARHWTAEKCWGRAQFHHRQEPQRKSMWNHKNHQNYISTRYSIRGWTVRTEASKMTVHCLQIPRKIENIVHTSHISLNGRTLGDFAIFFFATKHTIMLDLQLLSILFLFSILHEIWKEQAHKQQITCNLYSSHSERGTRLRTLIHIHTKNRQTDTNL